MKCGYLLVHCLDLTMTDAWPAGLSGPGKTTTMLNTDETPLDSLPSINIEEQICGLEGPMQLEKVLQSARRASDFLKALAHETRLLLLCLLSERERSVTELENILSLRQPTVSQQLARLRLDGLVTTRRDGKTIYYRINDDDVRRVISVVYDIFCREGKGSHRG
jgi:DNA-binding transcriptional ArsR family regulator